MTTREEPKKLAGRGRGCQAGRGRGCHWDEPSKVCICTRPNKIILCNVCGYIMRGRLRKNCSVHPLTLFLMDIEQCPRCKAYSFMMQEIDEQ